MSGLRDRRIYRASLPTRIGAPLAIFALLIPVAAGFWAVLDGDSFGLIALAIGVTALYALFSISVTPRIVVDHSQIATRNLVFEYKVDWGAVNAIEDYSRVHIQLASSGLIKCWAVQTPNFQLLRGKPGRAQYVAEEIRTLRGAHAESAPTAAVTRILIRSTAAWVVSLVALTSLATYLEWQYRW